MDRAGKVASDLPMLFEMITRWPVRVVRKPENPYSVRLVASRLVRSSASMKNEWPDCRLTTIPSAGWLLLRHRIASARSDDPHDGIACGAHIRAPRACGAAAL